MQKLKLWGSLILGLLITSCAAMLGGCARGDRAPVREVVKTVSVPVAVGCVSGNRPDAVPPLASVYSASEWSALSAKQKAELVAAQALRHQNRAQALEAATGACR